MNTNADPIERSTADFILFALMFIGFVVGAAGVITTSVPACVTGLILFGLGTLCFIIKGSDAF
jgi:hypothetical protein